MVIHSPAMVTWIDSPLFPGDITLMILLTYHRPLIFPFSIELHGLLFYQTQNFALWFFIGSIPPIITFINERDISSHCAKQDLPLFFYFLFTLFNFVVAGQSFFIIPVSSYDFARVIMLSPSSGDKVWIFSWIFIPSSCFPILW